MKTPAMPRAALPAGDAAARPPASVPVVLFPQVPTRTHDDGVADDLVDPVPAAFALLALDRRLAASDELGLHKAPSRRRDDGLLDELCQGLALAQDSLDFGTNLGLDTNGRKGG